MPVKFKWVIPIGVRHGGLEYLNLRNNCICYSFQRSWRLRMRLESMIGEVVVGHIPALNEDFGGQMHIRFKLVDVDPGGIWIECQSLTEFFLKQLNATSAERSPVFFVPFSSIRFLTTADDIPALSAKALGLEP